jgi:hypothetical protein
MILCPQSLPPVPEATVTAVQATSPKGNKPSQHPVYLCAELGRPCRGVSRYPFSSRFSSLRKRQSVPWAMIFWGVALIMPASWRRRA